MSDIIQAHRDGRHSGGSIEDKKFWRKAGCILCPKCAAGNDEAHMAHLEVNSECPWCGEVNADQTEFGRIDETTGTIYAASGDVIEEGQG